MRDRVEMNVCLQCGFENQDRIKFCGECGARLATDHDASPASASACATLADGDQNRAGPAAFGTIADVVDSESGVPSRTAAPRDGQYEILEEIGRGGMSVVYRARDTKLKRDVALKRILPEFAGRDKAVRRLMTEARSIANLQHYHIVHVYDISEDADGPFIAMEYVQGHDGQPLSLQERVVRDGPLPEREAVELTAKLCRGLAHAHGKGIIHRDIKPANILLTEDGEPKLADFGIARADESTVGRTLGPMTIEGSTLGSLDYMSPEQATDATQVDERTDIYSLGAVLYFCLTAHSPRYFRESNVPHGIRPALLKALERDRDERWASVSEFGAALVAAPEPRLLHTRRPRAAMGHSSTACPECGTESPVDARFCHKCGRSLSELFHKCPSCAREIRVDAQFCGGCGHDIKKHLRTLVCSHVNTLAARRREEDIRRTYFRIMVCRCLNTIIARKPDCEPIVNWTT